MPKSRGEIVTYTHERPVEAGSVQFSKFDDSKLFNFYFLVLVNSVLTGNAHAHMNWDISHSLPARAQTLLYTRHQFKPVPSNLTQWQERRHEGLGRIENLHTAGRL